MSDLAFALIVVAVVILIFMMSAPVRYVVRRTQDKWWAAADELADKSSGVGDGPAITALRKLIAKKDKTAADHQLMAQLINNNIMEGETYVRGKEAEATAAAGREYIEAARQARTENTDAPNITHLLDTAEAFEQRLEDRLYDEMLIGEMLFPNHDDMMFDPIEAALIMDDPELNMFGVLGRQLRDEVNTTRKVHAGALKQKAQRESKTAGEAADKYFKISKSHTSDAQNAHDSNVSNEMLVTLDIIERDTPISTSQEDTIKAIDAYIQQSDLPPEKKKRARQSLVKMFDADVNVMAANRKETDVLRLVWGRSNDASNRKNREAIQSEVAEALADIYTPNAWGEANPVCPSGRVTRIVGALSALDNNPAVGNLQTKEMVENQILDQANLIRANTLKAAAKSKDPEIRVIAETYESPDGPDETSPGYAKFQAIMKKNLDKMLTEQLATKDVRDKVYLGVDLLKPEHQFA